MDSDKRRVVDARGLACPQPVILTRRELMESQAGETVTVLVDNAAARENVLKLAASMGAEARVEEREGYFQLFIQKAQEAPSEKEMSLTEAPGASMGRKAGEIAGEPADVQQRAEGNRGHGGGAPGTAGFAVAKRQEESSPRVVLITAPTLGRENRELGAVLMKSFLYTLGEVEKAVDTLIFLNEGVRLVCEGSPAMETLQRLREKGIKILACGTCLDYLNLKEKLAVGEITNMYTIVELLCSREQVLIF